MSKVLLALVHNGELESSPASEVRYELENRGLVQQTMEIWEQPPLKSEIIIDQLIAWRSQQRRFEQRWRKYTQTSKPWSGLVSAFGSARFQLQVRYSPQTAAKEWRNRQIESLVTAKHIAAWRALMGTDNDAVLVLESDATWLASSPSVLKGLFALNMRPLLYANAAGGLDLAKLGLVSKENNSGAGWTEMDPPVTNTSCGYLISKSLAEYIIDLLSQNPGAEHLGIDWLLNLSFLEAGKNSTRIKCFHAIPPALGHGSILGTTESWHPDR